VTEDHLNGALGELEKDYEVVSGDYSDATNNLRSWVSEILLDQLMIELGESISIDLLRKLPNGFLANLKSLMKKALTKHIFHDESGQAVLQKNGQLMGSIISFPFLCMANAALCRFALENANSKTYRLTNKPYRNSGELCPLLINGDDCVFKGTKGLIRPLWEGITAMAGLESSVGKTYFSATFCTINSTLFTYVDGLWVMQKAINMGLMLGRSKSGEISNEIHTLGTRARELKSTCPLKRWPAVKSLFIKQNWELLTKHPLPWFLPEWLGGLGLPCDKESELSAQDLLHASIIKYYYNSDKKGKMRPCKMGDAPEWLMHQKIDKRLKDMGVGDECYFNKAISNDGTTIDLHDSYSKLYKALTAELLFKCGFYDLWELPEKTVSRAIYHNLRVFDECRALAELTELDISTGLRVNKFEPMAFDEISQEQKKLVPPVFLKDLNLIIEGKEYTFDESEY